MKTKGSTRLAYVFHLFIYLFIYLFSTTYHPIPYNIGCFFHSRFYLLMADLAMTMRGNPNSFHQDTELTIANIFQIEPFQLIF